MRISLQALESARAYNGPVVIGESTVRYLVFISLALAFSLAGALDARAGESAVAAKDLRQAAFPEASQSDQSGTGSVFVDLMAADFFESNLRLSQSRRIEAETAQRYLELDPASRARFRTERKRQWREMHESERAMLRGAKRPRFTNLSETQKETFRQIAAQQLNAAPRSVAQSAPHSDIGPASQLARGDI